MDINAQIRYNEGVNLNKIDGRSGVLSTLRPDTRKVLLMRSNHTSKGKPRPFYATLSEHFWAYCPRGAPNECWEWQCGRNTKGYGRFYHRHRCQSAHRVSWILAYGPIPDGLLVCHYCDNPRCCNPAHLFLGTNADNMADRDKKGRQANRYGQGNGRAKLTESDVLEIRKLYQKGVDGSTISSRFGVSKSTVSKVALRRTWPHVVEED